MVHSLCRLRVGHCRHYLAFPRHKYTLSLLTVPAHRLVKTKRTTDCLNTTRDKVFTRHLVTSIPLKYGLEPVPFV